MVKIPFRITQNQWYDYCSNRVIRMHLDQDKNGIDVGCHKGEIMDMYVEQNPSGPHIGFEPIPSMYDNLKIKYENTNVTILPYALTNEHGEASFNFVKSNPAYSGLIKRSYDHDNVQDEIIHVQKNRLDDCIDESIPYHLLKIDVEGGEFGVLKGAENLLKNWKPLIIFEHGMGASDHYGTAPEDVFDYLDSFGYKIYTFDQFLKHETNLSRSGFSDQFNQRINYYFVAQ